MPASVGITELYPCRSAAELPAFSGKYYTHRQHWHPDPALTSQYKQAMSVMGFLRAIPGSEN